MVGGRPVNWVTSARYLGIYLESSFTFKCSFAANKAKFYKAFNSIFGKIGRIASEEVIFTLIKSKCLPILLYGTEASPVNSAVRHSLQFALNRALLKIFGPLSKDKYKDKKNKIKNENGHQMRGSVLMSFVLRFCHCTEMLYMLH